MKKVLLPILTGMLFLIVLVLSILVYKDKTGNYSQNQSTMDDICGITDDGAVVTGIRANNFWGKAGLKGDNSEIYLILHNRFAEDDVLVGISSNAAKSVEIHLSQMVVDGAMKMIIQESVALPQNRKVEFVPGSFHIMLINLTRDLNSGDETLLTLHFQNQGNLAVIIPIKDW